MNGITREGALLEEGGWSPIGWAAVPEGDDPPERYLTLGYTEAWNTFKIETGIGVRVFPGLCQLFARGRRPAGPGRRSPAGSRSGFALEAGKPASVVMPSEMPQAFC